MRLAAILLIAALALAGCTTDDDGGDSSTTATTGGSTTTTTPAPTSENTSTTTTSPPELTVAPFSFHDHIGGFGGPAAAVNSRFAIWDDGTTTWVRFAMDKADGLHIPPEWEHRRATLEAVLIPPAPQGAALDGITVHDLADSALNASALDEAGTLLDGWAAAAGDTASSNPPECCDHFTHGFHHVDPAHSSAATGQRENFGEPWTSWAEYMDGLRAEHR